ncbi:MAG TPA: P1 family peptidase [Actinomycetota bacterium]|nr:P1 family peptidase [Actinomycetota bacterium]
MITAVVGIRVGHSTDRRGLTGCTVVLCPAGTVGSGEVRGGAPATRETDLLRPGMLVNEVHGVLLAGGSAFGLGAAEGVMRYLEERGIGFAVGVAVVPIVPGAALFDLGLGDPKARPGPSEGYEACDAATDQVEEGTVGAGTGATVAKIRGPERQVKGGIGSASVTEGSVVVGALFAVNAVGEVLTEDGAVLAGVRPGAMGDEDEEEPEPNTPWPDGPGTNTTIGVVATNARLSKERAHLLAGSAHDAVSGVVRPAHTIWDGDTVFTLATGQVDAPQDLLEQMAAEAVAESIRRGVLRATGVPGAPSVGEAR